MSPETAAVCVGVVTVEGTFVEQLRTPGWGGAVEVDCVRAFDPGAALSRCALP